jgi:hypothetical protein
VESKAYNYHFIFLISFLISFLYKTHHSTSFPRTDVYQKCLLLSGGATYQKCLFSPQAKLLPVRKHKHMSRR